MDDIVNSKSIVDSNEFFMVLLQVSVYSFGVFCSIYYYIVYIFLADRKSEQAHILILKFFWDQRWD